MTISISAKKADGTFSYEVHNGSDLIEAGNVYPSQHEAEQSARVCYHELHRLKFTWDSPSITQTWDDGQRNRERGVEVMDLRDLEEKLKSLLGGEYSSLTIGFNDIHDCNYATAQRYHDEYYGYGAEGDSERDSGFIDFISEDERLKALRENSVWRIQWYPNTPVGFNCIGASSLEALIDGLEKMTQGPNQ